MNSRDLIRALEKAGWACVAATETHRQFKHPDIPGRITLPHPKRDIPPATLRGRGPWSGLKPR